MLIDVGVRYSIEVAYRDSNTCVRGLDARYMISQLKPPGVSVLSLTTIATPHRGSAFADYLLTRIGRECQRIQIVSL